MFVFLITFCKISIIIPFPHITAATGRELNVVIVEAISWVKIDFHEKLVIDMGVEGGRGGLSLPGFWNVQKKSLFS